MKELLTPGELSFLASQGLGPEDVFDARHLPQSYWFRQIDEVGKTIALGSRCRTAGHRLRTRRGHCVQCDPKKLAYQARYRAEQYVYIAGSLSAKLIKIGTCVDTQQRERQLRAEGYGGAADWEMIFTVWVKNAGEVAAIFQEDILERFLTQAKVDQPVQYIYAGLAQSRLWLPIFYFARMSGKSNAEIRELVEALRISQKGKQKLLADRLAGSRSAFAKAVTRAATRIAAEITSGSISIPTSIQAVVPFAQGLTAVRTTAATMEELLAAVQKCRDYAEADNDGNAMGFIFKAACRIDELFFYE